MVNFHFMTILIMYNAVQVGGISVKSFVGNHEGKDISSPHTVYPNSPHTVTPIRCRCSHVTNQQNIKKLQVDCSGLNLTRVPDGIPLDTTILILDNNNISLLLNHSFVMKVSHPLLWYLSIIVWQRFCELARVRIAYCLCLAGWLHELSDISHDKFWEVSLLVIIGY